MATHPIHIGDDAITQLIQELSERNWSRLFLIADHNTYRDCYPRLADQLPAHDCCVIKAGEQHKNLDSLQYIWEQMTQLQLDRSALVLNLGGGLVGDMGGFAAATYKRGIDFIQVPTSLLAQVDASVGGKLGIDFMGYKNQVGAFADPVGVYIWPSFLETLPSEELKSGFAEVIKHHLIADREAWHALIKQDFNSLDWTALIRHSVRIKAHIVAGDPYESGPRKALNFGHTVGHAIESYLLDTDRQVLHGEAVAAGMIAELWLSHKKLGLLLKDMESAVQYIRTHYQMITLSLKDHQALSKLALQDKKNQAGQIRSVLLPQLGSYQIDCVLEQEELLAALAFYSGN